MKHHPCIGHRAPAAWFICLKRPVPLVAQKIAPGVEGPGFIAQAEAMERAEALKQKRDDSRWYIMMGVAMLFAGGLSAYVAAGGAAMCVWGLGSYAYWGRRMRSAYDPWRDDELDAWEDEHY